MIRVVNTKKENDLSFDEIYQEYYRRVFNYAFGRLLHREEAEDATAEVFLVLLQNVQSYDPKRGSVGTWISRITHNAVENYCRKAYRRKEFPTAELIRRKEEPVIMPIHKNEITEEMMMQAMQCKDADELIALAKTGGYEITKEEAETYMAELEDFELEDEQLKLVAGGKGWQNCQEPDSH
ncbi:MAG: Nif11-like leader peptide family RiPP precursor [Acidaminococcaceae bacterium]|nr:Nif11-like leader peptide family RiPP precursor [Acidaminococcaceae bacterium]MBQ6744537.1 Nif11-like leader peptide family RiPP precursor [Acidaminococcaceae bacterium]MBQ6779488.1 Nif11-like leader peptide family RiPP precursor [Acidaminococcaceae bacterium]